MNDQHTELPARRGRHGALLINLVVAMTVLGGLGAGIVAMTTSSTYNPLQANGSARAYYLAEAGGQYALSLLEADPTATPSGTFRLSDDRGRFALTSEDDPTDATRLIIRSTGIMGQMRRRIFYNFPKTASASDGETWDGSGDIIPGDNAENPDPGDLSYDIVEVDGDDALRVLSLRRAEGYVGWIFIRESMLYLDAVSFLRRAWEQGGYYLSYDAQVKMAADFYSTERSHFMGLNMRMDQQEHAYGVAFAKGANNILDLDGIPTELLPDECSFYLWGRCLLWGDVNEPLVVFWQDNGTHSGRKWLAYRELGSADNILQGNGEAPLDWSTLLARVRETPSIYLTGVTTPVQAGDVISQTVGGATAVAASELLKPFDGATEGAIMLASAEGVFAPGAAQLNGVNFATVSDFRAKDNFFWVFMADPVGSTPDTSPYTADRSGHARGDWDVWPPRDLSDWTTEDDFSMLIAWDEANTANPVTHQLLGPEGHPRTVIRTAELTSPDAPPFEGPELGLQTFGWNAFDYPAEYWRKDYLFDDFALRVDAYEASIPGYQY